MKPIIAITTSYDSQDIIAKHFHAEGTNYFYLREAYCDAVLSAGGIPILLPFFPDTEILKKIDGLLLSDAGIFGLTGIEMLFAPPSTEEHKRSLFECILVERAVEIDLPILGICFGMQLLNIVWGGTICWDIKTFKDKKTARRHFSGKHKVLIKKGTLLRDIIKKKEINVYSSHKQAISHLGKNLVVSAVSEDGLIEAIELPDKRFFIGVQFHPEVKLMIPQIFQEFIKACAATRKKR